MSRLLAVDPGLDVCGLAVFQLEGWTPRESIRSLIPRLERWEAIRTPPSASLPSRLYHLHSRIFDFASEVGAIRVVLELPATAGAYSRNRGGRTGNLIPQGIAQLNRAIGALVCGAFEHTADLELVPASRIPKKRRLAVVRTNLRLAGHSLSRLARPSPDILDAIGVGLQWLIDPARCRELAA